MRQLLIVLLMVVPLLAEPTHPRKATEYERNGLGFSQSSPLPQPDAHGEYRRDVIGSHPFWVVVAPDGLNGREAVTLMDPGPMHPLSWPVVRSFQRGQLLNATAGPHPQILFLTNSDADHKCWMRVLSGDARLDEVGVFVRAHKDYIRPVRVEE